MESEVTQKKQVIHARDKFLCFTCARSAVGKAPMVISNRSVLVWVTYCGGTGQRIGTMPEITSPGFEFIPRKCDFIKHVHGQNYDGLSKSSMDNQSYTKEESIAQAVPPKEEAPVKKFTMDNLESPKKDSPTNDRALAVQALIANAKNAISKDKKR